MNVLKTHLNDDSILRLLYTDDLQIYIQVPIDQMNHGLYLLSEASCKVSEWAKFNWIKLNTEKTKAIAFGMSHLIRRFKESQITSTAINNNNDLFQYVDEVGSLGDVYDRTLSWGPT